MTTNDASSNKSPCQRRGRATILRKAGKAPVYDDDRNNSNSNSNSNSSSNNNNNNNNINNNNGLVTEKKAAALSAARNQTVSSDPVFWNLRILTSPKITFPQFTPHQCRMKCRNTYKISHETWGPVSQESSWFVHKTNGSKGKSQLWSDRLYFH